MTTTDVLPSVSRADVSPETASTTTTQSPPIVVPIKTEQRQRVEASCSSAATRHIDRVLRRRVIGQDDALDALMSSFARLFSGLRDPGRPVLTGLLLGPTGVGKTETARALSPELRAVLDVTPVAALSAQLRKRGLDNVTIDGARPTHPEMKLIGVARTLRFVPNREDLLAAHGGGYNARGDAGQEARQVGAAEHLLRCRKAGPGCGDEPEQS